MKQILQNMSNGNTQLVEVPCPAPQPGHCIIGTTRTLVSVGTERMLVNFGKANLVQKARSQPDKVKLVLEKVKTDGLSPTLEAVRSKLDKPLARTAMLEAGDTTFRWAACCFNEITQES